MKDGGKVRPPSALPGEEAQRIARRKLLSTGGYLVPGILATLVVRGASGSGASCHPYNCSPPGPCGPNGCPPVR